jgi:hypothetical protein
MLFVVGNVREFRVAGGQPSLANCQPSTSSLVAPRSYFDDFGAQ